MARRVCKANAKKFVNAKQAVDHVVLTASPLATRRPPIDVKPPHEWPKAIKFLKLYRGPLDVYLKLVEPANS